LTSFQLNLKLFLLQNSQIFKIDLKMPKQAI
jgi:hypothetical protein